MTSGPRPVRAPRGLELSCRGWKQEAALRMLMNNLDPDVAEDPDHLVVYGGTGRAVRSWEAFDAIVATLQRLADDETLLVQSGKPVGVFRTHELAPRVLLANSHLVPDWADWATFRKLEAAGLTMYGQMTAGSWIYIGTQGIVQGTYETFGAVAQAHFGGTLRGRLVLTAGCGGMGGAQPLAVAMNDGVCLIVDVDPHRLDRRVETRYLDLVAPDLDAALREIEEARGQGDGRSVGLVGDASEVFEELLARGVVPDVVTDQTSAHDPLGGYVPAGYSLEQADELRASDPERYIRESRESMARQCAAMVSFQERGAVVFDYGNSLRAEAKTAGYNDAFRYPGFVEAYVRPLFCKGIGPFRWAALSGNPDDIAATDRAVTELFPENDGLQRWMRMARERIAFQGLPARICWLGYGERHRAGLRINELVRSGEVTAPIVIGRDHLDSGSVASPYRETEGMRDGSDAIADWPLLNAMLNVSSGAAWVALHHGGGVGIGRSIHSGAQVVADGTDDGAFRLERVLTNDPGTGVMRHADAGYEIAVEHARATGLDLPDAAPMSTTVLVPELVLGPDAQVRDDLAIELRDGRIGALIPASSAPADAQRLPRRLLVPGMVNAHSHAFQLALRGRVERVDPEHPHDDFWTWREEMYAAAGALDPAGVRRVSEACFREARLAGYTTVGEFHYVHHRPDGTPYDDPNALAHAVCDAARASGIRLVLLMTAYARAGEGLLPTPGQRRFCDASAEAYLARVDALRADVAGEPLITVGYAPHSVRAVPRDWLEQIAAHAAGTGLPVHVHADEQPREIDESIAEHGLRPIALLDRVGLLGPRTTIIHATHADDAELDLMAQRGATVCACPSTEANLGDGFLPADRLWRRGVPVAFGSDSNTRLDPFEEARETEGLARRQAGRRNVLVRPGEDGPARSLWECLTVNGARALGVDAGVIAEGAAADLVALDLDHREIAHVPPGHLAAAVLFSGSAALVRETWVAGS